LLPVTIGYGDLLPQPPPEPNVKERATDKARQMQDELVRASSNAWQRVNAHKAELSSHSTNASLAQAKKVGEVSDEQV
jgi:hypothetical protein